MIHLKIIYTRIIFFILALIIFVLFSGCKTLLFKNLFGSVSKIENVEDYQGYWESDDGFIAAIKILDDSSTMVTGVMDWDKKKEQFVVSSEKRIITKIKEATFLNQKTEKNYYMVQQFELKKSKVSEKIQLLVWDPNIDEFEKLVNNNELPGKIITTINDEGKVETDSVIVDNHSKDLLEQLMKKNNLFKYKNVQVLRRVIGPMEK
jgi:hypothetical protein